MPSAYGPQLSVALGSLETPMALVQPDSGNGGIPIGKELGSESSYTWKRRVRLRRFTRGLKDGLLTFLRLR